MADQEFKASLDVNQVIAALRKQQKENEKVARAAEKDYAAMGKAAQKAYNDAQAAAVKSTRAQIAEHKKVLALTKQLNKELGGNNGFKGIGASAQLSGVQIGAVAGVVAALTQQFIQLGKQAIAALVDIGKQSVQTAIEIDTLKARLGGIFDGNKEAAEQAFTFIQKKSKELGVDLSEFAGALIPKTESLAQFERAAKVLTALARSDPEQGTTGARIALLEGLSGQFTSLQRRFEFTKDEIQLIKDGFKNSGVEGFLSALEQVQAKSGKSFEDLENTASTTFARMDIAGKQIGGRLGVPIVDSLERASNKILDFINENEDDLILFADTVGRAIGNVIDLLASFNFEDIDTAQLEEIGEKFFDLTENVGVFVSTLSGAEFPNSLIDGVDGFLTKLNQALVTLNQLTLLSKAQSAAAAAETESLAKQLRDKGQREGTGGLAGLAAGAVENIPGLTALNSKLVELVGNEEAQAFASKAAADAEAAYNKTIQDGLAKLDASNKAKEDNRQASDDLRTSLDEEATAGTAAADAAQALARAQDAAAASASELADAEAEAAQKTAEATEKFNQGVQDAETDLQRKLADVEKEGTRKRLDAAAEFAQKRVDLATDNAQKIADIERKNQQGVADADKDLERNEQDIATKFARDKIKLAKDQADKQVDIEKDFRRQIADIRKQFNRDAEEAERSRDAVGFLAALRKRNQEITDAQTDRNRKTQDTRTEGQQRRAELALQHEQELEDARLAHERKLEDLQTALDRELEAQAINFQQAQDALTLAEQRKNEEIKLWQERAIEDANLAHERKLEDLQTALDRELEALKIHVDEMIAEYERLQAAAAAAEVASAATRPALPGSNSTTRQGNINEVFKAFTTPRKKFGRRAEGGPVGPEGSFLVGERGPELFSPSMPGVIIPNDRVMAAMRAGVGGGTINNNGHQISATFPLSTQDALSPIQRVIINQMIKGALGEVIGRK